ncbi:hypothetical protein [Haloferula rosea]|uniref:Uncharacterized protein n=1 Tax=Haloferula rosea TaxID=490093 RepID=A0A934VF56_9BACT|nr:hypothetical protein [Haloferula rosea]MBK1826205.1 hypothetical protein [Haloferula rosea]
MPMGAQGLGDGMAVVPVDKVKQKAPLFYSVDASTTVAVSDTEALSVMTVQVKVHQGRAEKLTLELSGSGEIQSVAGAELDSWAVRRESDGSRFLDLYPKLPAATPQPWQPFNEWNPFASPPFRPQPANPPTVDGPKEFKFTIQGIHEVESRQVFPVLLPGPGEAVGFSSTVTMQEVSGTRIKEHAIRDLGQDDEVPEGSVAKYRSHGLTAPELRIESLPVGVVGGPIELNNPRLEGRLSDDGTSLSFVLRGQVNVREKDASIELFEGVAITDGISGANWRIRVVQRGNRWVHELVGTESVPAKAPIQVAFEVAVNESDDWRSAGFRLPAGVMVPVRLKGLGENVTFDKGQALQPHAAGKDWLGYLNPAGQGSMRWKSIGKETDGALFFSSSEITEVRVGAGLMRQASQMEVRVLQGKLEALRIQLDGPGEVLAVEGAPVLGWSVSEGDGSRFLDVKLSRPIEGRESLAIQTQSALGTFPVKAEPMRLMPVGALRHSGHLRIANEGAVRLEVVDSKGVMQLAPGQFPGEAAPEGLRQVFVYRFPSAEYEYAVAADQVLPEVSVSEVTIHEMGETDRRILVDLELDIREAPIREWTVGIPDGFAVAELSGASVADYNVASEGKGGVRPLKILFGSAVAGRQLVTMKLERNQSAAVGDWALPRLRHEGAKSTRGFIGVASAPGYRVVAGPMKGLVENPVDYFPKKMSRLQQAFRMRDEAWSLTMKVEALGQSVQADVFHLYSLKEGVAYGSVLLNYFVVGAPATEWRIQVPEGVGNIDVTGQGVGRDWRRDGETLIVPLARPALGLSNLLVTFEQPMSARGGALRPGEIRPLDVQSERGYVQVTSPLQVNYEVTRSEGSVLRIDASELPAEYRLLTSAPTLGAWQYTAGDVGLEMNVKWYESGEAIGEVIDFASLESHVSRDNQVVTTASLFAKTKGAATLEIELPEDAELWEATVDGARVNARKAGAVTRVPLPRGGDSNEAIKVELRYGQRLSGGNLRLDAPKVGTATAIANWVIKGDEGRRLLPGKSGAQLVRPVMTETGAEWVASTGRALTPVLLVVAGVGFLLCRMRRLKWVGVLILLAAAIGSFMMSVQAGSDRRVSLGILEYAAPAVLDGDSMFVEFENADAWAANVNGLGVFTALIGVALLGWALLRAVGRDPYVLGITVLGVGLICWGILAQHGGAIAFFGLLGLLLCGAAFVSIMSGRTKPKGDGPGKKETTDKRPSGPAAAATASVVALLLTGFSDAKAAEPAESVIQSWQLEEKVVRGTLEIQVQASEDGQRFLMLSRGAILREFKGAGLKVMKEGADYYVVASGEGPKSAQAEFEFRIANLQEGWMLPTGPAAIQTVFARSGKEGWDFHASGAASIRSGVTRPGAEGKWTEIHLTPAGPAKFSVQPEQRDASREETRFFTEVFDLYLPGPGVVSGRHRVVVRPAQGVVREVILKVPDGFTVGEVDGGPVGRWRFNPESRELTVAIEPAKQAAFGFNVFTQQATSVLPVDLKLAPMRVLGGAGSVGMLGLAFGNDAQPEAVKEEGMSPVNLDDFPNNLRPAEGQGLLQRAYRYGADAASLSLRVAPVSPEVRIETKQTLSLGDDRMVMAIDLMARITRAGVFRLVMELPDGLEVESVTGGALSHWTESKADKVRLLTLNLNGRTMGEQAFTITLAGASPGSQESWKIPRLVVRDATRQRGSLVVVPGRGLQVRAVERSQVSQLDPGDVGVPRPGALAFRLLQSDWSLALAVQELDPWVTAQVMHHVTLREGQMLTRARLIYRIENAARKQLRVRLPGLDEQAAGTVRATGPAVGDFVPVEGEEGVWEIRFQRGVAGTTTVDIEFQRQSGGEGISIEVMEMLDVRQTSYFVGITAGGRLDAEIAGGVRGWQKLDWSGVPAPLREDAGSEIPDFIFRVAEPEGAMNLRVDRHDLADSEPLRGREGQLRTLVSPTGSAITSVDLKIDVSEKSTLRLTLPGGVSPFNLLVNGEGVPLVQDGGAWLFYVVPSPLGDGPAQVKFTYATRSEDAGWLEAPALDVPLENLTWDVYLPEGWELADSEGSFQLVKTQALGGMGLSSYMSLSTAMNQKGKAEALAESKKGYEWLASGDQEKASKLLGKAARNGFLDEAAKEDARVQYRNLKMQQAVLGLNTRRQRNYLDNRFNNNDAPNQQLEQAAEENPILQGQYNFDPQQFDRLMVGNSAEETSALKAIAGQIVEQQMEVVGAPESLDIELMGQGRLFRFTRSLQVKGGEPMTLQLNLTQERPSGWLYAGMIGLLASVIVVFGFKTGRKDAA